MGGGGGEGVGAPVLPLVMNEGFGVVFAVSDDLELCCCHGLSSHCRGN